MWPPEVDACTISYSPQEVCNSPVRPNQVSGDDLVMVMAYPAWMALTVA